METFVFKSTVCRMDGGMQPHVIPVPNDVSEKIWQSENRRLIVGINGYELRRALQGSREFGSHIVIGRNLLKEVGVKIGDTVSISIRPDPDPDSVEICDEFLIVLEQDSEANERWEGLTPGMQRSIAHHVNGAKREETRVKRSLDIAMKLKTRTLHRDG